MSGDARDDLHKTFDQVQSAVEHLSPSVRLTVLSICAAEQLARLEPNERAEALKMMERAAWTIGRGW